MREKTGKRWQHLQLDLLFLAISSQIISGFAADPSGSKDGTKSVNHSNSSSSTGVVVLYICLGVAAVILLGIFLLKMWKKKKREEQHARLLRLFEEDDELEVELGLRD